CGPRPWPALPRPLLSRLASTPPSRLSDAPFQPPDHVGNRFAFCASGKGQRHAMLEHWFCQFEDIVDGRRETAVQERARAHRQHQRLARSGAGPPGDKLADIASLRPGPIAPVQGLSQRLTLPLAGAERDVALTAGLRTSLPLWHGTLLRPSYR